MFQQAGHGDWIPLVEFAVRRGVSLSTLRRYIKANKVEFRVENGRYLLFDDGAEAAAKQNIATPMTLPEKLMLMERDLRSAKEEIAELKMLVALYEEKISPHRLSN